MLHRQRLGHTPSVHRLQRQQGAGGGLKGLCFRRFPVSNSRSLPTHTRREHFPLDASLFYELS